MSIDMLSQGDLSYYKRYSKDMLNCHESEFAQKIDPSLIRAMYRGRIGKEQDRYGEHGGGGYGDTYGNYNNYYNEEDHVMAMVKLFQAANTILPNLYFQNPSPIVIPKRNSDPPDAALMCAGLKYYKKLNKQKQQNQEAVLNSYFFGIGWKKMGYRSVFPPAEPVTPETELPQSILQKIAQTAGKWVGMPQMGGYDKSKPDSAESRQTQHLAEYETMFNDSENPMNVATDHKADLHNAKARLYSYNRTLFDIVGYGAYDPETIKELREKFQRQNGSRFDDREIELKLRELHIMQKNGLWILSYVDEFEKPLRYDKSGYQGKGFLDSPLVLTNEPGIRYPTSHMRVASHVQKKLDKLASMYVEMVARSRRLLAVNEKALSPGQMGNLEQNLIQGILKMKGPFNPQDIMQIASTPVSNDLPNLIGLLSQTITEITGADSQLVSGKSDNKTLGQDELARMGTQIRESGMVDRVRDWEIDQLQKEGTLLKQYSNTELNFVITKSDYPNPAEIQQIEDEWVSFMTPENPLGLKEYLQGEFDYDCAIEEAVKPNRANQQKQYQEIIMAGSNPAVQTALQNNGVNLRVDHLFKNWMESCEGIGNTDRFLEQLDSAQLAAMQVKQVLMGGAGGAMVGAAAKPMPTTSQEPAATGANTGKTTEGVSNPSSQAAQL